MNLGVARNTQMLKHEGVRNAEVQQPLKQSTIDLVRANLTSKGSSSSRSRSMNLGK